MLHAIPSLPTPQLPVIAPHGAGEALWFLDNLLTVKASGRDGTAFSLVEAALPAGSRTPYHRHADEDEAFYVLSGELTFFVEGRGPVGACAGDYVHMPAGLAHGFRTESAVTMLIISGPAGFVAMARDAGSAAAVRALPPPPEHLDVARLARIASAHGIELLGPLPE